MNRKISFSEGEYYHIYNRGTDKRKIFLDKRDRERFIKLLYLCNGLSPVVMREVSKMDDPYVFERGESLVDIGAYCLMPNHFHILLREKTEGGIPAFMKKMATAYSMYFNTKYKRTGTLFQGVFMAQHATKDEYLKYLFAYIHLNPIKMIDPTWKENGIQDHVAAQSYLEEYWPSSYLDYHGVDRPEAKILNRVAFPEYFSTTEDFNVFVNEWLAYSAE